MHPMVSSLPMREAYRGLHRDPIRAIIRHDRARSRRHRPHACCDTWTVGAPSIENIARVLLRDWDPLGVAETDEAPEREYLFEAGELSAMLARGASVEAITAYLGSRSLGGVGSFSGSCCRRCVARPSAVDPHRRERSHARRQIGVDKPRQRRSRLSAS